MSEATRKCPYCDAPNKINAIFCIACQESLMDFGFPLLSDDARQAVEVTSSPKLSVEAKESALAKEEPVSEPEVPHHVVLEMATAWLSCISQPEFIFELHSGNVVGRKGDTDVSSLESSYFISREHARFYFQEGRWQVENLSQTNGTYVNGIVVPRGSRQGVIHGDKVTLGNKMFLFQEQVLQLLLN